MKKIYKENPCIDCEKPIRHPGCHGSCKMREEWLGKLNATKDQIYSEKNKISKLDSYEKDMAVKRKKRTGNSK